MNVLCVPSIRCACVRAFNPVYVCTCVYLCVSVCIGVYRCVSVCMCVRACVQAYLGMPNYPTPARAQWDVDTTLLPAYNEFVRRLFNDYMCVCFSVCVCLLPCLSRAFLCAVYVSRTFNKCELCRRFRYGKLQSFAGVYQPMEMCMCGTLLPNLLAAYNQTNALVRSYLPGTHK